MIKRRKTKKVRIGNVEIGGGAPVSIQSMTKTETKAVDSTLNDIRKLKKAGCDIVRVAVSGKDVIPSLKRIIERSEAPVVADIHFLPQLALEAIEAGSAAIRLNPGNIKRTEDIKIFSRLPYDFSNALYLPCNSLRKSPSYSCQQIRTKGIYIENPVLNSQFFHYMCGAAGIHPPPITRPKANDIMAN